ncbi:MAG: hypothetical protein J5496_07075 [Lachnospiraceae bacterium]|nr:hypothetical protein [Lachnospiraceae bacterium]
MVCKYCGCENLEGSTHCVYCGEPLPEQSGSVGSIMSAFAGISVEDSEPVGTAAEKHAGMTVISAVGRLRRTDVSSPDPVSPEEEEKIRQETQSLMESGDAEQIELNWSEAEETAEMAAMAAEADAARRLSEEAAEIVSRAVEKIVGNNPEAEPENAASPENAAPEEKAAPPESAAEEPAPAAPAPEAEAEARPHKTPEIPDSPFNFQLEEIPEKETEEEPAVHNFVQAAAAAVPAAGKISREEAEEPAVSGPEPETDDGPAEETREEKNVIDFLPNIALTGTSQIIKETQEEEEQAREEAERRSAYAAAIEKKNQAARRRRTQWIWILLFLLALLGVAYLLWIRPMQQYNKAVDLMQKGNYREALALFSQSGDYKDARVLADECLSHLGVEPVPATSSETLPPAASTTSALPEPSSSVPTTPAASTPEATLPPESSSEIPPVTEPSETTEQETTPEATTPEETTAEPLPVEINVGQVVRFGQYEQDNNTKNGKEEIEWIVLEVHADHVVLISRYILDQVKFLETARWASYSSSGIREWLTGPFYQNAFSQEEKQSMIEFAVNPGKNPKYATDQAATVYDEVGILSVEQVEHYFRDPADKQCTATAYALKRGVYRADNGFSPWWTCTMGKNNESACLVRSDGAINYEGREMMVIVFGARPVIWVKPEALQ